MPKWTQVREKTPLKEEESFAPDKILHAHFPSAGDTKPATFYNTQLQKLYGRIE